jgi:hypothetical protein
MKKVITIISVLFVVSIAVYAQNLVPNYSFEDYSSCPMGPGEIENATSWATPDSATPDYYNACFTQLFPMMASMDVPDNIQGFQHAHTGDAYGGIICYEDMGGIGSGWREYMRIQLTSPLTAGTEYKVRFWWSLADKSPYSVEQIGILITDEYINYFGGGQNYTTALPYSPTVATSGSQLADTANWVLHEECFIAQGGEEWIYIGNFRDDNDVNRDNTGVSCDMQTGGCFAYYFIDDVSIEEGDCSVTPCELTVDIDADDPVCGEPNGSATAVPSQGTQPISYQWNTGSDEETITELSNGDYSVTVTDGEGCTATASVTLYSEDGPTLNTSGINITDANCNNNDGAITGITVSGGTQNLSYSWENVSGIQVGTSIDLVDVPSGSYSLTVTDANGCTDVAGPFTINDVGGPVIDDDDIVIVNESCDQANGSISGISVTGGSPSYSYSWYDSGQNLMGTDPDIDQLAEGEYLLEVTDDNGCISQSGPYTITNTPGPTADFTAEEISCHGANDGSIDVSVSGGTLPYDYEWNTGETTQDLNNLGPGQYMLTITDENSCEDIIQTELVEPDEISITTSEDQEICYGESVDISASTQGGTSPFTYYWGNGTAFSQGLSTLSISPENDTTCFVFALDANGCSSDTTNINITVHPTISVENFSDTVCVSDEYEVSFDVYDHNGNPAEFIVDGGIYSDSGIFQSSVYKFTDFELISSNSEPF